MPCNQAGFETWSHSTSRSETKMVKIRHVAA